MNSLDVRLGPWSSITIGVSSLDKVLDFWCGEFGFEATARHDGPDEGLSALWDLPPDAIRAQAIVATPGLDHGHLHFVEFKEPGPAVREGAQTFDMAPKNLDVYVRDLPARFEAMKAAGFHFRAETYSEVTAQDGTRFREIHLTGHDAINIVLLELLDETLDFSDKGAAGIGFAIQTVSDGKAERAFYLAGLGLDLITENLFEGPAIEEMVGLPKGAGLDVSIVGDKNSPYGQVELVEYQQVTGTDLYPRAKPPARGLLHLNYRLKNLAPLKDRLAQQEIAFVEQEHDTPLFGSGKILHITTPAGFGLYVFES